MTYSHAKILLQGLQKQSKEERHTDVTLSTGDKEIKCHGCMIAAVSKYTKLLCTKSKHITLEKYANFSHVETLISKLYCENVTLAAFIFNILPIAKHLKIDFILGETEKIKKAEMLNEMINDKWMKQFISEISAMRKSGFLCDVKLKVDEREIHCHKAILAAVSTYFDTMFQSGMKEALSDETVLHGLDKNIVEKILDYIYTGENILTIGNIQDIMSASVYLQLPSLQKKCENFLIQHLDPENCIGVLQLAEAYSNDKLHAGVTTFILRRFEDVFKVDDFLTLRKDQLINIIKTNNLNISSELEVLEAVIKWFDNNLDISNNDFQDVIKYVRNLNSTEVSIDHIVQKNVKKRDKSSCKEFLQNIISEDAMRTDSERHQEVLMVVNASSEHKGVYLTCYSFTHRLWYELEKTSYEAGCNHAVCCSKNDLFINGGSGTPNGFICYHTECNQWTRLENLAEGRSDHMAVFTDESVYVLGGSKPIVKEILSDISRYDTSGKVWRQEGRLCVPVANASCAVVERKILVFGGNMPFLKHSNHIQCFDTVTKSCIVVSRLPKICSFTGITLDNDTVYIVCPEGHIIRYQYEEKAEAIGKAHTHCITDFGTVLFNNKILILGGSSTKFESDEVESFDLATCKGSKFTGLTLPWNKKSNQYFGTFMWISKLFLTKPIS